MGIGATCGLKVGFSTTAAGLQYSPAAYIAFVQANFNLLTPQNELKWAATQPSQGVYNFTGADYLLAFCQKNGMALRGHNLCWNSANPAWLTSALTVSNAESILVNHINMVAGRYAGQIDSWDVVNEPISVWENQPGGLSSGPWLSVLGQEYIDIAFHTAAAADPLALRVLNLHEVEMASDTTSKVATLNLLDALLKRGVPVQAVGFESHIDIGSSIDLMVLDTFVQSIRSLGLQVLITELDVNDSKVNGSFAERDAFVAEMYEAYLNIVLPAADPQRLVFWSITDNSWMDAMCEDKDPEYERADGLCDHRPGLIDSSWQLKPAYAAVAAALQKYASTHYVAAGLQAEWSPA
jgi:endo-1,4-beta-xylanase